MLRTVTLALLAMLCCATAVAQSLGWSPAGSMAVARQNFTATRLQNGQVLAAGGFASLPGPGGSELLRTVDAVEVYNPVARQWTPRPSMGSVRSSHTATLLGDGRVLVTGGTNDSTEIFDPVAMSWSPGAPMAAVRRDHTATLLPDGRVLIAGGFTLSASLSAVEIYDPVNEVWLATGSLNHARYEHTATLLGDGRVLVVGGTGTASLGRRAEVYDPVTGVWTPTPDLTHRRYRHTATRLPDGKVLVTGGTSAIAELYDPVGNTWTATGAMSRIRRDHTAVLMSTGELLVAGGDGASSNNETATAETYSFLSGTWAPAASMAQVRTRHAAALLQPGDEVLVAGGASFGSDCCIATAEVFGFGQGPVEFVVDTATDSVDIAPGDGICSDGTACSLRAAVMESNALAGANVVTLPAGLYLLQLIGGTPGDDNGSLDILDALTINGGGADATIIDGGGLDGVLSVGTGVTAEINDVTLQNGDNAFPGGGIFNGGLLTIRRSAVRQNIARGGFPGGGGIYNNGQLTVFAATISGNFAQSGGGIYNSGMLTLSDSTVSGNTASNAFTGVRGGLSRGGGIVNDDMFGSLYISHSTVTGNVAADSGGGILNACGGKFCTAAVVDRSIFAGNSAPFGPDCNAESSTFGSGFHSDGFNLFGDVSGCPFVAETTDLIGVDPMLAPLGDYGGPTWTHALRSGSPAIDHIGSGDCSLSLDQRGVTRPQDAGCDAGAYEAGACYAEVDATFENGLLSLEFVLGSRGPAQWTVLARTGATVFPLWSVAVGIIDPPIVQSLELAFPPLPSLAIVSRVGGTTGTPCLAFDPAR